MTVKSKNIFDHIRNITEIQNPTYLSTLTSQELKEFNIFLLQKFLGMHNDLTYAISYIDKYVFFNKMSKEHYYKLLIHMIPKGKYWLKFEKKDTTILPPTWFLSILKEYFVYISKNEAIEYYQLLSDDDKLALLTKFGHSENKLTQLI